MVLEQQEPRHEDVCAVPHAPMDPALIVQRLEVQVRCACGDVHDFDTEELLPAGTRTELTCDGCGRRIAVDADAFVQYLPDPAAAGERAGILARLAGPPDVDDPEGL